jgi:hypothetical protein
MVPYLRCRHIQQSANILGDYCLHRRWEWGTMAAAIGHLGQDALMYAVGWLWAVIYVRIRRVLYQVIGDTLPMRWQLASLSALEPVAWQPPRQIGCCIALSGQQHHWGMMCDVGGGKIGGIRTGGKFSYTMGLCALINHGSHCCPTATMGPHSLLLSMQQSAKILWSRSMLIKLEKLSLIMFIS